MEIAEILSEFERSRGYFPEKAVREAISRKEELTPHLLEILRNTIANAQSVAEEDDHYSHFYAIYLLAGWRETAAYPLIIQYARLPGELPHDLGGDLVTEDLGRILASVCDGDLAPIHALIEDPDVDEYVRSAALRSLLVLVAADRVQRDDVIGYFKVLFNGCLERKHSQVWDSLASYAADLQPRELMDDIRRAYEDDMVNPAFVGLEEIERDAGQDVETALGDLRKRHTLVGDPIKEMSWWNCFQPKPTKPVKVPAKPVTAPVSARIARTGPCPCGSRRKYKKCCSPDKGLREGVGDP